ncbi:MAG TPA: helix-turn-helix transcriptional regulator [Polyangia bacterium]|jgi:cytoskeletal protein RodZ
MNQHVGIFLRKQREARGMTLAELSRATKIKESSLVALEEARYEALPARVFVVGWVGAVARAVGADPIAAVELLAAERPASGVHRIGDCMPKVVARAPEAEDAARPVADRRRVGIVVAVFLLLIVATLTLSLLLHHGGRFGGGMS